MTEYKLSNVKQINDSAERNAADLNAGKDGLSTAAGQKLKEIETLYDAAKQSSSDDALKRGLACSSIIVNKLSALESEKTKLKADTSAGLIDSLNGIDNKINELETKRMDALDEFDLVYAAKLGEEIQKQKEERQKRLDEIIKYNNSLKKQNAEYGLDYAKTDSALNSDLFEKNAEIAENDLVTKLLQQVYQQKYTVISDYLYNMDVRDAVKDLENRKSYYMEQLGKNGYDKMVLEQKSRK